MHLKQLAAALLVAGAAPAFAAIAPGNPQSGANSFYNGNGELFLVVFDSEAKISFTLDLGITQNEFFVDGQTAGYSRAWSVGDDNFTTFLNESTAINRQWMVLATDSAGGSAPGNQRLFTTVKNGQAGEFVNFTNQVYSNGIGSTQAGTFFNAVNLTGTHGVSGQAPNYAVNGSSVNRDSDNGNSYVGDGSTGLSSNLNGNAPFSFANAVGEASEFYNLTRSSFDQLGTVSADLFDDAASNATGSFLFAAGNGGYALSYSLLAAPVPEPGTYALLLAGLGVVGMVARRRRTV